MMNKPLHDISNHKKNLQHEIRQNSHVPKDKKTLVKDIITL